MLPVPTTLATPESAHTQFCDPVSYLKRELLPSGTDTVGSGSFSPTMWVP